MVVMALRLALILSSVTIAAAAHGQQGTKPKVAETTLFKPMEQSKPLRILGFFPFNGFSHFQMFKAIMLVLARKGHHVTVVSSFKLKKPEPNYRDIDLSEDFPSLVNTFEFDFAAEAFGPNSAIKFAQAVVEYSGPDLCRKMFTHPKLNDIFSGKDQYDVVFTEIFGTECWLAVGHKLKIPTIAVASTYNYPWTADYTGDVDNPAFFESLFLPPSTDKLSTIWRRLENTRLYIVGKLAYYWYSTRPSEAVIREFFGEDAPSVAELRRNVSLVLSNCHEALVGAKASVPRFLQVAGIHLTEPDFSSVPKDIAAFLDTATDGVLYFTLGSLVRTDSLPPRIKKALTGAFERLKPLRVLWKYESAGKHADIPDNVMVASWMPQMEILAHPNVKGFMTHGGLMGSLEALYNEVPMVGIPIFGDQFANIEKFQSLGIAVALNHKILDEETVYQAIKKVVYDPEIRTAIKDLSLRFRDRPTSPAEEVTWWTEYVVRHGGAPYLEAPTSFMPFYQYLLLDVIAVVVTALVAVIYLCYLIIKLTLTLFRANFQSTRSTKKKN